MTETWQCPRCGARIDPAVWPEDSCPRCMIGAAGEDEAASGPASLASPDEQKTTQATDTPAAVADRIRDYRLLQKLGAGGMGEVWEAEQERPVRRRVALKLIKAGMDTEQVIARFESERQALALMNHPNIAQVFDAGKTERGRPYFAMELVKGEPITTYCDRQRLDTHERLQLFQQVCEGVQHAHQKGIIHRDLKPTNILVKIQDNRPIPKVIDFGVAKATEQRLTEKTVFTQAGVLIGTPEYMSPEQAELTGLDIDTRTDVYALGVLLYEVLVGALPFDSKELREAAFDEIRRRIREEEPSKPSTRISTLGAGSTEAAERRRTDPPTLRRQLRGDLDWITMKALEKDRTRRYGSPSDLAADISRHLAHEPVLAGPPSVAYRIKKFVRRHRFGAAAAATGVLVLVAFAATMAVQARRIASERDRVELARADLESVVEFQSGMLSGVDAEGVGRRLLADLRERLAEALLGRGTTNQDIDETVTSFDAAMRHVNPTDVALQLIDREILMRAVGTLEEEFAGQPLIDAQLRHTIGATYLTLGLYEEAERQLNHAVEIRMQELGRDHPDTLRSKSSLARVYNRQYRWSESEELYRETLELQRRVLGPTHPDAFASMTGLANAYFGHSRYAEAEKRHREILEIKLRLKGQGHPDTLMPMYNLALAIQLQGRYAEAEKLYKEHLEISRTVLGQHDQRTLLVMSKLANVYIKQERYDEAATLHRETLEARRRVLGQSHRHTRESAEGLAKAYLGQGRSDDARPLVAELLRIQRMRAEERKTDAGAKNFYAWLALTCEPSDLQDPRPALRFALQANELTDFQNADYLDTLALAYHRTGDTRKAIDTQKRAISLLHEDADRSVYEMHLAEFESALQDESN